jgi:hypothetical protein
MNPMRIGGANIVDPVVLTNGFTALGGTFMPNSDPVHITRPNDLTHDNWQVPSQRPRQQAIQYTAASVWQNLRRAFRP